MGKGLKGQGGWEHMRNGMEVGNRIRMLRRNYFLSSSAQYFTEKNKKLS